MARTEINAEKKAAVISEIKGRIQQAPEPVLLGSFFEELNAGAWSSNYDFVRRAGQVLKDAGFFIKSITGHGTFAFHQEFEIPEIAIMRVSRKRMMTSEELNSLYEGICDTVIETGYTLSMTDIYNERGAEAFDHQGNFVAAFKRWLKNQQKAGKFLELILDGRKVLGSFLGTDRAEIDSFLTVPERQGVVMSRADAEADKQEIAERIVDHVLEVNGIVDMASLFEQEKFTHVDGRAISKCEKWWRIMFIKMLATDSRIVMLSRRGRGTLLAPAGVEIPQEDKQKEAGEPRKRGRQEGVRYAWRQTEDGIISYKGMRSTPNFNDPRWEKLASVPVFLQRTAGDVEAVYMMHLSENKSEYATLCSNGDVYIYSPK